MNLHVEDLTEDQLRALHAAITRELRVRATKALLERTSHPGERE